MFAAVRYLLRCRLARELALRRCCRRIGRLHRSGAQRAALLRATRLWNVIDNGASPEWQWAVMQQRLPWFFRDPADANSARFTY